MFVQNLFYYTMEKAQNKKDRKFICIPRKSHNEYELHICGPRNNRHEIVNLFSFRRYHDKIILNHLRQLNSQELKNACGTHVILNLREVELNNFSPKDVSVICYLDELTTLEHFIVKRYNASCPNF